MRVVYLLYEVDDHNSDHIVGIYETLASADKDAAELRILRDESWMYIDHSVPSPYRGYVKKVWYSRKQNVKIETKTVIP